MDSSPSRPSKRSPKGLRAKRDDEQKKPSEERKPRVETLESPEPKIQLLPYQQLWVADKSPLKIVVKGRQTGFSFASSLHAVLKCVERKRTWILLSKGERQSRLLMEKVQEHIQTLGIVAQAFESTFFEGTMLKTLETRFANGSVIYGLPANPDTARGYSGDVMLDEFAFHIDPDKIYAALYPTITRGFSLEIVSTPNGQQGKFFELAKEAGLTEGDPVRTRSVESQIGSADCRVLDPQPRNSKWSGHWCDIYRAAREGLKIDLELLRAGVDDETWRQEFCCEFLSGGAQWIPPELFQQCLSSEASVNLGPDYGILGTDTLYAGWDIARNRDLSVVWLSELVGDVTWTRGLLEMRNLSTPEQLREVRALMPSIRRLQIDKSGMGLAIYEALDREFPGKVEGVQFTQPTKEAMAVLAKRRMEETKVRIPDDDRVRASFRSVKKTVNAVGQARFDSEHDAKFGHADHWWAFCMAEVAAQQPIYHLAQVGAVIGRPVVAGVKNRIL